MEKENNDTKNIVTENPFENETSVHTNQIQLEL